MPVSFDNITEMGDLIIHIRFGEYRLEWIIDNNVVTTVYVDRNTMNGFEEQSSTFFVDGRIERFGRC